MFVPKCLIANSLVAHFMGNDKNRLEVLTLVYCATVAGLAHSPHPGQTYHTVVTRCIIPQVQTYMNKQS